MTDDDTIHKNTSSNPGVPLTALLLWEAVLGVHVGTVLSINPSLVLLSAAPYPVQPHAWREPHTPLSELGNRL